MSTNRESKLTDGNIVTDDIERRWAIEQDKEQEEASRNAFSSYVIIE